MTEENQEISLTTLPETIEVEVPLDSIPVKAQQVMALLACGFSVTSVAKLAHSNSTAISNLVDRFDPDHKFTMSAKEKRKFLGRLWEARAGEALLRMTPEKMEECSALQLAAIAKMGGGEATRLASDKEEEQKDPYALLARLGRPELLLPSVARGPLPVASIEPLEESA
jgi:hypothetical protein